MLKKSQQQNKKHNELCIRLSALIAELHTYGHDKVARYISGLLKIVNK